MPAPSKGWNEKSPAKAPLKITELRRRFAQLHKAGTFLMPNAWDVGSARILASLGFPAIATTSSGFAASLGLMDQQVTLGELEEHVGALVSAVDVSVSVDAENCYADSARGVVATVDVSRKSVQPGSRSRTTIPRRASTRNGSQPSG